MKKTVGKYLVRRKYAVIRWIDDDNIPKDITSLGKEIKEIASETDVKHLPDYKASSHKSLIEGVKNHFIDGDIAKIITRQETHIFDLFKTLDLEKSAVKETIKFPSMQMILAVKKPDYLGKSKWKLKNGRRNIKVKMKDTDWLKRFQSREEEVRPGDFMKCKVEIEHLYGHDKELITEHYTVTQVIEVLDKSFRQFKLF